MSTIESPVIAALWQAIEERIGADRVVFGGSVPDVRTELPHSYHRSWDDSPHDNGYSVHYPGDKSLWMRQHCHQYAAALDVTFHDPADIMKATARLHHWSVTSRANWTGPAHSPLLREYAGTLDHQTVYAADLTRFRAPVRTFGWDDSHLFHIHLSFNRWRVLDRSIIAPIVAAFGDW